MSCRVLLITLFLISASGYVLAQNQVKVDSLELQLKNAKSDTVRMRLMIDLSMYYLSFDNIKAARYAQQAKDLSEEKGNKLYQLKSDRMLAAVFFYMGDYKTASVHFFKAMKYYEGVGDSIGISSMLINLGAVHEQLREFDEALRYYLKAQSILNTISGNNATKVRYLTSLYNNVANIYHTKGDFQSARQYYEKTLSMANDTNNKPLQGIALNNLGKLYSLDLKDSKKAFEYLTAGLKVRMEVGNKREISMSYLQLSTYYYIQHNYSEAKQAANQTLQIGKEIASLEAQKSGYQSLSTIEEALGNYKESLRTFRNYKRIDDSIKSQVAGGEISKLQFQYDLEKAEQKRLQEQEKIRARYTLAIIILAAGLSIAILIVVAIRSRAKQTELKQKNLVQDVEIKNKELTTNVMYLVRKNELINNVAERLLHIKQSIVPDNQKVVHDIILDLQREGDNDAWKEFELRFNQVHSDFYDKLRSLYPGLSPADEKLCAFLRLNMSSKEIAAITNQNVKSVEVARARLRKKLNLTNTTSNLVTHLTSL